MERRGWLDDYIEPIHDVVPKAVRTAASMLMTVCKMNFQTFYNPAFDLYHSIFRMAHIAAKLDDGESLDVDKVRIWDFYLLFPDKVYNIHLRSDEEKLKAYRNIIKKQNNPYDYHGNNRKLFEWIKPVQVSALGCLVSCGMLDKEKYEEGRVCVGNRGVLTDFFQKAGTITQRERNVLSFMSFLSRAMSMTGEYGLKSRTELLESKYDAE